jgi:hypothetical protein
MAGYRSIRVFQIYEWSQNTFTRNVEHAPRGSPESGVYNDVYAGPCDFIKFAVRYLTAVHIRYMYHELITEPVLWGSASCSGKGLVRLLKFFTVARGILLTTVWLPVCCPSAFFQAVRFWALFSWVNFLLHRQGQKPTSFANRGGNPIAGQLEAIRDLLANRCIK